ncbi:hypothetical protein RSK20926_11814 [Roseobacter sp. SK209-2-6]|nr:hypothetical protein RSK20926_11814 [Roseobacter sp. SK209-2-6]
MVDWTTAVEFCPVGDSFWEEPEDAVLRTQTDSGPVKSRRRYTAVPISIRFTLPRMTNAQYAEFQAWFENDVKGGSIPFTALHPITREQCSFQFVRPYRANKAGRSMQVHLELERLP